MRLDHRCIFVALLVVCWSYASGEGEFPPSRMGSQQRVFLSLSLRERDWLERVRASLGARQIGATPPAKVIWGPVFVKRRRANQALAAAAEWLWWSHFSGCTRAQLWPAPSSSAEGASSDWEGPHCVSERPTCLMARGRPLLCALLARHLANLSLSSCTGLGAAAASLPKEREEFFHITNVVTSGRRLAVVVIGRPLVSSGEPLARDCLGRQKAEFKAAL